MRVSHTKVECWRKCPRQYYYQYIERISRKFDYSPTDPRTLGKTLDVAVESGMEEAERYYWSQYHDVHDEGILELMKMEYWLPQLNDLFRGGSFQIKIASQHGKHDFIGFADCIVGDTLYDMKYSNNADNYRESSQLHVYASELPERPKRMAYVCVPRTFVRQKQPKVGRKGKKDEPGEDTMAFRRRAMGELEKKEIQMVWVEYDQSKVDQFWADVESMEQETEFAQKPHENCKFCDYKDICKPVIPKEPSEKVAVKPRSEIDKLLNS